jgi:hypothetical protein
VTQPPSTAQPRLSSKLSFGTTRGGTNSAFDTQVPHWFGSTGDGPAEILSIFGRPGERMNVRTEPSRA